jgi:hypothetical protein
MFIALFLILQLSVRFLRKASIFGLYFDNYTAKIKYSTIQGEIMKQKVIYLMLILLSLSLLSCSDDPINTITIQNMASGDVILNFKASEVDVPNGATVKLTNIEQGEYEYETIYEIPASATSSQASGEMAGTFIMNAGTKYLVIYTSVFKDGVYSISASVTSSDDLSPDGGLINPLGK